MKLKQKQQQTVQIIVSIRVFGSWPGPKPPSCLAKKKKKKEKKYRTSSFHHTHSLTHSSKRLFGCTAATVLHMAYT